jgi:hypothetical protein
MPMQKAMPMIDLRCAILLAAAAVLGCSGTPKTTQPPTKPDAVETKPTPPSPAGQSFFVHESMVDCEGASPMRCMQVRGSESEEWTWFYDGIEGFEHEEGYRYELRVEVTEVENPPADGSSKRYRLVEVVSKEKAEPTP